MATKKIIVVIGATGNQGGSVARTFLDLSQWHVRCLTRNPRSEQSRELASRGAEIVQGDLDDPGSLKPVFEGATAIFLNTDFWQTWRPARAALEAEGKDIAEASQMAFDAETSRGRNAVDVASTIPTLQRFVYSSLPDITKVDGGKHIRSKHTASKGWIVDYIADKYPELNKKTSLIYLGAYTNNPFLTPRHDPGSGKYVFALPMTEDVKMPVIDARESTGPFVRALVEDEEPGTKLLAYDQEATIGEIVKFWVSISHSRSCMMFRSS